MTKKTVTGNMDVQSKRSFGVWWAYTQNTSKLEPPGWQWKWRLEENQNEGLWLMSDAVQNQKHKKCKHLQQQPEVDRKC